VLVGATQSESPAGSFRAQDFEVRTAETNEHMKGAAVSNDFFAGRRVQPLLRRTILRDEKRSMQVAVISYRLWNSNFQADPAAYSRTLQVNDRM